jgi:O-antigen/teichoic acid export membrane protein
MALAMVAVAVILSVVELGVGAAIVQFHDLDRAELNTCFWLTMVATTAAYVALWAAAPLVEAWFAMPGLGAVLRVVGLNLPLTALGVVPDGLLRRGLRLDRVSQVQMTATLVTLPIVAALAWRGFGVWALVAGSLVTALVQVIGAYWFEPLMPGFRLNTRRLWRLVTYSCSIMGGRLTWTIYDQADTFVLGKLVGNVWVGHYAMAKQLALLPADRISAIVNQLAAPLMAALQEDLSVSRVALLRAMRLTAAAAFPLAAGLALVADDLVRVVLGPKWTTAAPFVTVLSLHAGVRSVATLLPPFMYAQGAAGFVFRYSLAQLVIMPAAFCAGALAAGPIGVAAAWLLAYPLMLSVLVRRTLARAGLSVGELVASLRPALVAACVMAVAVLVARGLLAGVGETIRLVGSVAVGALTYCATVWWAGSSLRSDIRRAVTWVVPLRAQRGIEGAP